MKEESSSIRKCERCGLVIADATWRCPLCSGAITFEGGDFAEQPRSLSYPDISERLRKMRFATRIAVFVSAVISAIAILINYLTFNGVYWSLMTVAVLVYACATLIVSFREKKSTQWRIFIQCVFGAAFVYALDRIIGYSGWSVSYGFPIIILTADLIAVIMMSVNRHGWQNYIITEITACGFGVLLFILEVTGVLELSPLGMVAAAVSILVLAGTLLFGKRMIREEVKRRFRV